MLLRIFLVLSCNVLLIKSHDHNITLNYDDNESCSMKPNHTFIDGEIVTIRINSKYNIEEWCILVNNITNLMQFNKTHNESKVKVDPSLAGEWKFGLLQQQNNNDPKRTQKNCLTIVKIVDPAPTSDSDKNPDILMIAIAVGVAFTLIILAQTSYILYLKAKARSTNLHEYLSKKAESVSSNDQVRYCTNPVQKQQVAPIIEPDPDSDIYELPNSLLPEREPAQPPQPPALSTLPRSPRIDTDVGRLGPLALAAALNSARYPAQTGPYPGPKPIPHEVKIANRPRMPLPPQETYEETSISENTYEPPPNKNTLPPVRPKPPQKLIKLQLDTAVKTLSLKPVVTPKPQTPSPDHMTIPTELENAWRRRNVVQVPIVSIPGPSSRGTSPHRPRPAPVVKPKPKPPKPQPMDQGTYYNNRHDSSDEEWTYEPIKPIKDLTTDHIYDNM